MLRCEQINSIAAELPVSLHYLLRSERRLTDGRRGRLRCHRCRCGRRFRGWSRRYSSRWRRSCWFRSRGLLYGSFFGRWSTDFSIFSKIIFFLEKFFKRIFNLLFFFLLGLSLLGGLRLRGLCRGSRLRLCPSRSWVHACRRGRSRGCRRGRGRHWCLDRHLGSPHALVDQARSEVLR